MIFLVNASQIFEKGDPKNFIPDAGIQRIADTLIGWKEEEKLSRIVDLEELRKNNRQLLALEHVKQNATISNRELQDLAGVSESTALRELNSMVKAGLFVRTSRTGRAAQYALVKKPVINPSNPS
jgi:type I restriction enzyme M protein